MSQSFRITVRDRDVFEAAPRKSGKENKEKEGQGGEQHAENRYV